MNKQNGNTFVVIDRWSGIRHERTRRLFTFKIDCILLKL